MSERLRISKETEKDYDALLEHQMPLIEKWMDEHDVFAPCGAALAKDGQMIGHMAGVDGSSTMESAIRGLLDSLRERAQAGDIRASIVCFDGGFEEDGDFVPAIVTLLEHVCGPALIVHRPYRKNADGEYEYAQSEAAVTEPEVFLVT